MTEQLKDRMIRLQTQMDGLRVKEADAFERKLKAKKAIEETPAYTDMLKAEQEMKDCIGEWYKIFQEYLECKELFNASKV